PRLWLRGLLGLDTGNAAHLVVGVDVDDAHAHRIAALARDVIHVEADHLALAGDHEHVVPLPHLEHAHHRPIAPARLDVDDALARAPGEAILVERRALAVAAHRHRQHAHPLLDHFRGDDLVMLLEVDALHPGGHPPRGPELVLGEADEHALLGREQHLALAV